MPTYRGPDFLTSYEQADIKTDLASAVADTNCGSATIVYSRLVLAAGGSATFNASTGVVTSPYTDTSISAIVGSPTDADAIKSGVTLKSTDRKFLIDRSGLAADPASGDQIIYDGTTFDVVFSWFSKATNVVAIYAAILGGEA